MTKKRQVKYYIVIFLVWSIPFVLYFWFGFGDVHPNHADSKWIISILDLAVPIFIGLSQVLWTYVSRRITPRLKTYPENWGRIRRIAHFLILGRLHHEYP